jgi:hypothetical protein
LLGAAGRAQVCTGPARDITYDQVRANSRAQLSLNGGKVAYTYPRKAGALQNDVWTMNADGSGKTRVYYDVSVDPNVERSADTFSSEWPALSADGTKVVFHAWDDLKNGGQTDIILVDTVSGQAQQLTTDPAMDAYPAFSPDGTKVVFLSKRNGLSAYQVFVMKAEPEGVSNVPVQLTNFTNTKFARFTPDGKIIFGGVTTATGSAFEVFRMDAVDANNDTVGDNLVRLTNSGGVAASEPSQPTAGGRIYYVGKFSYDGKSHVLSMNADGSDIRQVTGGDYDETYAFAAGDQLIACLTDPANGVGNADIEAFPLGVSASAGTVSGTVSGAVGAPIANATVKIYTLKTLVTTVTTNASGAFTASLPPGGYSLEIIAPNYTTALRGVTVTPSATASKNVSMALTAAPAPVNVMATYVMDLATMAPSADPVTYGYSGVGLTWGAGAAPGAGYTVSGYNVYAASSESGPWTKLTTDAVVAPEPPLLYTAAVPADPAKAFYAVTTVATNGSSNVESALSVIAQAANNVLVNGNFDAGSSNPVAWDRAPVWWEDPKTWSVAADSVDKVGEGQSTCNTAGTPTAFALYSDYTHTTPVKPGEAFVASMYAHFTNYSGANPLIAGLQYSKSVPSTMWWGDTSYPAEYALPNLVSGGAASPTTPWTYLANTNVLRAWEDVDHTRFAMSWDSTGATPGPALDATSLYLDDARLQVRRIGATGTIYGRVQQSGAKSVGGILVTGGGKSARTDGVRGQFVLTDVPTGMVELTFTFPDYDPAVTPTHQFKVTVPNYGGFAFGRASGGVIQDTTIWETLPRTILATVKDENGAPVANANLRFQNWNGSSEISGVTDANGVYSVPQPAEFKYGNWWDDNSKSIALANAPGRVGVASTPFWCMTDDSFGGWDIVDITLPRSTVFEAVKTASAPTIDGNVTDAEWSSAQKIELLKSAETGLLPKTRTWVSAKWDANNLYLAFTSEEPTPTEMVANSLGHDGSPAIWNGDDLFAVWLDPTNFAQTGVGHEYWQLMTNSNTSDPGATDIMWRQTWAQSTVPFIWLMGEENIAGLQFKSKVDTAGKTWYTEMAIPFAGLGSASITGGLPAPTVDNGTEWATLLQRFRGRSIPGGENAESGMIVLRFVNSLSAPVKGDLNSDGAVTAIDAAIALKIAAGVEGAGSRVAAGDVAGSDSKVTIADAVRILRFVDGLQTSL